MCMNRKSLVAIAFVSLASSSWGQGVGLWAPGAVLDPGRTSVPSSGAVRSNLVNQSLFATGSALPRTVLTPTGRYLITTDPATGYVSSIIEVSRTRD